MSDTADRDVAQTVVDWGLAVSTARRLVRPGPDVTVDEARRVVADLREYAALAESHVRDFTGLHATGARAPVVVVDRNGWVQANADAFREVLTPLEERIREKRGGADAASMVTSFGSRITGVEAGALLAFLSGKVLGQFDPFWTNGDSSPGDAGSSNGAPSVGRLLLVAPNVAHVERELGVDPRDFRLWVCLHEETHRVQFTAVPWLRDYMRGEIRAFLEETDLDPGAMLSQLRQSFEQVGKAARNKQEVSLIDLVQTPAQKTILDRLTAVMSLLEGHADVVMDGVGPDVVPSVATIRERFQHRRSGGTWLDQLLKRMLGLDAKLRQYKEGAAFVRQVVDRVGLAGFNQVWASAENLPTRAEITDPDIWVRRVHGTPGSAGAATGDAAGA